MVNKGEMRVFDSNCIAWLQIQVTTANIAHNSVLFVKFSSNQFNGPFPSCCLPPFQHESTSGAGMAQW